jgi:predicted N-acetyltransferase YhbS
MSNIIIRPMQIEDGAAAKKIFSQAFGTFIGIPEPESFASDRDFINTRRNTNPEAAFVAELDGEIIGSNFAVHWGSVGFFGPLTIRPDKWNQGVGRKLMTPIMDCFEAWKLTHCGLYTFPGSTKHIHLYQQYGFWPRFLTAITSKSLSRTKSVPEWSAFSDISNGDREAVIAECFELTNAIYPGLNLNQEILGNLEQSLGDTVLVRDNNELVGMAVCHCGPGTEAGEGNCFIKFGAVQSGPKSNRHFDRLLAACEELAINSGQSKIDAGINLARQEAHGVMLERGYQTTQLGISMHQPNEPGYSRAGAWVIDDWR